MSKDNTILYAALAVGAVLLVNKAGAPLKPAGTASAPVKTTSVQNQLWTNLFGNGWKSLVAGSGSNAPTFVETNAYGQTVTSDGKPVGGDGLDLVPSTYGQEIPIDTSVDGVDYLGSLFKYGG